MRKRIGNNQPIIIPGPSDVEQIKMAEDDEKETKESQSQRKMKGEIPKWSETCIGFWSKDYKEIPGKDTEEKRRCRGISILRLNKVNRKHFYISE